MSKKDWNAIDRAALAKMYADSPATEIAKRFGVTSGAVYHRLRVFRLTARHTGVKHSPGPQTKFKPTRKELMRMYRTMTMRAIAEHFGVGETVVFNRLRDYGIKSASRSERLTGIKRSLETRLKVSRSKRGQSAGDKNPNWKGGITSKNLRGRVKGEYFEWKSLVLHKADYKCAKCGVEHGSLCKCCGRRFTLQAHHIKHYSKHPELRYEPKNGVALCERCHREEH